MNISNLYFKIFQSATDGVVVINQSGIIQKINPAMSEIFGYDKGELEGQKINVLMQSPHKEAHDKYLREYREGRRAMEIRARRVPAVKKDGKSIIIELHIFPVDEYHCAGIIRDLSHMDAQEQKKILEAEDRNLFAANISHELRTPLNSIINMNILLEDDLIEVSKVISNQMFSHMKDCIDTVKHSGTLLLTQINDILDYSKLVSGKLSLRTHEFPISECIDSAQKLHQTPAREKNIEIIVKISPNVPDILLGDSNRLTQVIVNLLGNAVKFTDNGKITINVWVKNKPRSAGKCELHISIADTGIGIDKKDQELLFREFRQIDNSHTKKYPGTGLGLVICKKICQLMGGDIFLKKSMVDSGSNFEFYVNLEISRKSTLSPLNKDILKGKTILLVDDEPSNLITYSSYLLEWGATPIQASGGENAMVYVKRSYNFDLALLDVRMPRMNGIELANKMKKSDVNYPIVGLSSVGSVDGVDIFDDFAEKPITKNSLLKILVKNILKIGMEIPHVEKPKKNNIPILVAEDNIDNQKVISQLLKKFGYKNVDITNNGQEALDAMEKKKYHIVLLDIKMPVMDGLQAAKLINEKYGENRPTLIALTAVAAYGGEEFYITDGGMDDYISKPIDFKYLKKVLEKY